MCYAAGVCYGVLTLRVTETGVERRQTWGDAGSTQTAFFRSKPTGRAEIVGLRKDTRALRRGRYASLGPPAPAALLSIFFRARASRHLAQQASLAGQRIMEAYLATDVLAA